MLEKGLCAFGFQDGWGLEGSLRLSRDLGFTCVDVGANQVGGQDAVQRDPLGCGQRIAGAAAAAGVRTDEFFALAPQLRGKSSTGLEEDPADLAEIDLRWDALCRCARAAGCSSILGGNPGPDAGLGMETSFRRATANLVRQTRIAADHGLVQTAEVDADGFAGTEPAATRFTEAVPLLRFTLDYAHWISRGRDLSTCLYLHRWTRHLHFKQAAPGYLKRFWSRGTIDFRPIVADLGNRGWQGTLSIETAGWTTEGRLWPVYREVRFPYEVEPASESFEGHPVHQAVLHARGLEEALS
jgi:sugar phosphate isomerase/epimerase